MKNFLLPATDFIREEEGASAVEYAILVAAIATVIVSITVVVGGQVTNAFENLCQQMKNITNGTC